MAKTKLMDAWTNGAAKAEEVKVKDTPIQRGRPKGDRIMKVTTIKFYEENYNYMELRSKQLKAEGIGDGSKTAYINWLIDQDMDNNPELAQKIKDLF